MDVFLPIAQVFVSPIEILLLSALVGVLSGLFGVGGGFLMTPFLIFLGIPPVYAVPNEINNILATSVSGSMTHWFKNTLDYKIIIETSTDLENWTSFDDQLSLKEESDNGDGTLTLTYSISGSVDSKKVFFRLRVVELL